MIMDGQGKLKAKNIDQMVSCELCAYLIIWHGLPFSFVGYEELKTWITYLNLDATLVSTNTIKRDVLKILIKEKSMLKQEFNKISNRICLTLSTPDFVRALMVFFPSANSGNAYNNNHWRYFSHQSR